MIRQVPKAEKKIIKSGSTTVACLQGWLSMESPLGVCRD